jgi:hypothetical protein
MNTQSDTIQAVNDATRIYTPPYGTRSVLITNNSGYYCLVRSGGTDAPSFAQASDGVIQPRNQMQLPIIEACAIRVTNAPFGEIIVSETDPQGVVNVVFSTLSVVQSSRQLGTTGVNIPSELKQVFPYGYTPESVSAVTNYASFASQGLTWLRLYAVNTTGNDVVISVTISLDPPVGPSQILGKVLVRDSVAGVVPAGYGIISEIPLPLVPSSAGTVTILPSCELNPDLGPVSVWPVLHL